jgi:hypothetical protein
MSGVWLFVIPLLMIPVAFILFTETMYRVAFLLFAAFLFVAGIDLIMKGDD